MSSRQAAWMKKTAGEGYHALSHLAPPKFFAYQSESPKRMAMPDVKSPEPLHVIETCERHIIHSRATPDTFPPHCEASARSTPTQPTKQCPCPEMDSCPTSPLAVPVPPLPPCTPHNSGSHEPTRLRPF